MTKRKKINLVPKEEIQSFSQEANAYRNIRRPFVGKLFAQKTASIKMPNGKKRKPTKREAKEADVKARNAWRTIIRESNKL